MVFWSSTSFRSCVHPKGTSYGHPHWAIRAGRSTPFRSALIPNIHYSRSLLIDRCGGVLFPVALTPGAGYKASLRVQSERSAGVPPVSIRAGRSTPFRSALIPNIYYSRYLLIIRCGFDSDVL